MGDKQEPLFRKPKMPSMRTFQVIGRGTSDEDAKLYKMKLFAPNEVVAKSRYWYFLSQIVKAKKTSGEIVSVREVHEKKNNTAKNYGLFLRYDSRSGTHNMYKEFRDVTLNGAIDQMYQDMAGRHRTRKRSVYVVKAEAIPAGQCKRKNVKVFHDNDIKFPLPHSAQQRTHKRYKSLYAVSKPSTHVA